MRSKYFAIGFVAGVLAMLLWPGEETQPPPVVSVPDTVEVITVRTDSSRADSLRREISLLQARLERPKKARVVPRAGYNQYRSRKVMISGGQKIVIDAFSLTPVDSFRVEFLPVPPERVLGLQKESWYTLAAGIIIGIIGWEIIR